MKPRLVVKTGNQEGAGTDANVWVVLEDEACKKTSKIKLDRLLHDDLERGRTDYYPFSFPSDFGTVERLLLSRDSKGFLDDWFCDYVIVQDPRGAPDNKLRKITNILAPGVDDRSYGGFRAEYYFPIHRWILPSLQYSFRQYVTCLPHLDPDVENRKKNMVEKKKNYKYIVHVEGAATQVAELPSDEKFSDEYYWTFATDKLKLLAQSKMINWTTSKWKTLDLLKSVYKLSLGEPEPISYWKEDWWFGLQRVQGVNPMVIKHCKSIPDKLDVTQDTVEGLLDDFTLQEALEKNRLFICDLAIVDGLPCNDNRKLAAPMALFYLNKKNDLLPVAIQLMQQKGPENPVYTPQDSPNTWLLAKLFYNNAEAQHHQGVTHLGYTHLLMEGVCVCTHRNLSPSHPMFKLMAPHFLFLLAINSRGLEKLLSPGGWVDNCMTQGVTGIFELMKRGFQEWKYDVHAIPETEVGARGVLDPDILPYYPYRDDAVSLFKVIKKYVTRIVTHHYDSPEKLQKDWEIHAWRKELAAPRGESGVGLDSLPGGKDGFTSVQEVIDVMAFIISTCSLGHASSNFQQYEQYGFVPNYPGILFKDPPTQKSEYTEADLLSLLPDMKMTLDIMVITKLLSSRGTNSLGNFEMQYFYDPVGISAAEEFRKDLQKLSLDIQKRNIDRRIKYPWLDPAIVPNAISV